MHKRAHHAVQDIFIRIVENPLFHLVYLEAVETQQDTCTCDRGAADPRVRSRSRHRSSGGRATAACDGGAVDAGARGAYGGCGHGVGDATRIGDAVCALLDLLDILGGSVEVRGREGDLVVGEIVHHVCGAQERVA